MLLSYVVIYAIDAPLENRKISLNRVCADNDIALLASVNAPLVANRAVLSVICAEIIRNNVSFETYVLADYLRDKPEDF